MLKLKKIKQNLKNKEKEDENLEGYSEETTFLKFLMKSLAQI